MAGEINLSRARHDAETRKAVERKTGFGKDARIHDYTVMLYVMRELARFFRQAMLNRQENPAIKLK